MTGFAQEWNALHNEAAGGGFLLVHNQLGVIALPTNPTDGQTLTLTPNGTGVVIRFKTTPVAANDVKIGGTNIITTANLWAFVLNPGLTTSNQIAATAANQQLLEYAGYGCPGLSTNVVVYSNNRSIYAPLTSFTASTTVTGGSWTAATLKLYVQPGAYYLNGTRVLFTGASSPAITAPASNPRIDLLTVDPSGTVAITTGTEGASPATPSYPSNKLVLAEIYNVVGETGIYDNANQQTGQGYIYNDVRPEVSNGPILSAIPDDILPDATDTRSLGSASYEWLNIYGENVYAKNYYLNGVLTAFKTDGWGDGSDGTVSISTTVTLTRDMYYNTLTVTGTGILITAGYRVFVLNVLTVNTGGLIHNNGGNASGSTGGTGGAGGNLAAGANGGNGGGGGAGSSANQPGNPGTQPSTPAVTKPIGNLTSVAGGSAGQGGTYIYGGGSGAAGGAAGAGSGTPINYPRSLFTAFGLADGSTLLGCSVVSGAGGGGGGGGGTSSINTNGGGGGGGGGAGGNGGFVWIAAFSIVNNGTIQSNGGNGANGGTGGNSGISGGAGGGGGGGGSGGNGGVIVYICSAFSGNTPTTAGGTAGTGGSPGTGASGMTSGSSGNAGVGGALYALQTL